MSAPSDDSRPPARRATLVVFWDYDTAWGADRSRTPGGPKSWGPLEFVNTERLLELHAAYDVPACFAVVGSAALPGERPYSDPAQVRRIHASGHEVASHSHRHEWLPGCSRSELLETLRSSKDALEQCIGASVGTFVPPFNQPFDHPAGWSFSLSERREAGRVRNDLRDVCEALAETGYSLCRVAYRSIFSRVWDRLRRPSTGHASEVKPIGGIACMRLSLSAGFDGRSLATLERASEAGDLVVAYGHPHSLHCGDPQDERWLVPFLERVRDMRRENRLQVRLPREFVQAP